MIRAYTYVLCNESFFFFLKLIGEGGMLFMVDYKNNNGVCIQRQWWSYRNNKKGIASF